MKLAFKTSHCPPRRRAFTLIEVMVAIGVFCLGVFAILGLIASVMRNARILDKPMVDASAVFNEIAQTNELVEISGSGELSDLLGKNYKGFTYVYSINEAQSNKLFQVDVALCNDIPGKPVVSKMTMLLFRPLSPAGTLDGHNGSPR